MDRKKLPALAAGAALAVLLGMNASLLAQVEGLSKEVDALQRGLQYLWRESSAALDRQETALREELERGASLFDQAETALEYRDGQLVLEAAVVPKELRAGETVLLTLDTGESVPLTGDGTGWLRGRLACSLREEVTPAVTLRTGESTRQEVLPSLWTAEVLSMEYQTEWESEGSDTILQITLSQKSLGAEEVWVEIRDAILDPEDPGSLVGRVQAVQEEPDLWKADLGAYLVEGEDYDYACHLGVRTEGGLELASLGSAAEWGRAGNQGHRTSGSGELLPFFRPAPTGLSGGEESGSQGNF